MSQGFSRYIPPDYDSRQHSTLNSAAGKKHALGKRAKDIDKGVLVVRFELPFNIWCGSCDNHIGAGVRYNAQKSKVGNYYSTPIYAFRCKCHLCGGHFVIQTDPKNAAYVITEGARRQDDEWDPAENGGYAAWDTEGRPGTDGAAAGAEPDAFEHLEKDTDQVAVAKRAQTRLDELAAASDRLSSDPWAVSRALRSRFRVEKAAALEKQAADDGVRERFGLHDDVHLPDTEAVRSDAAAQWTAARVGRGLAPDVAASDTAPDPTALADTIRANTKRKYDVFGDEPPPRRQRLPRKVSPPPEPKPAAPPPAANPSVGLGGLAGYDSASDSD